MPKYLDYLANSTDVVKSKNRLSKLILILTYLAIWALVMVVFWFFTGGSDALGYSFMFLWVLLPVATFVVSFLIGKHNYWGKGKWLSAPVLGAMYMLAEYATFSAANMAAFGKLNMPSWGMILTGGAISLLGLAAGTVLAYCKARSGKEKNKT